MKKHFILSLVAATLLSASHAVAQETSYERLKSYAAHIVGFNKNCPQEKVFLHFDNKAYYLGETIWFSAYVVDASTLLPIAKSKVLYVELLTPDGDIVASKKLKIVAGRCYGNLDLIGRSETFSEGFSNEINVINALHSGFYEVRAYTREMQNFGEGCYFSRVFPVYDTPENDGDYAQIQITTNKTERSTETRKKSKKADDLNIDFYPEGGALIQGIESRVAFKATDAYGLPAKITEAMKIDGKKVAIGHDGMGSFLYTPTENSEREVNVTYEGKNHKFKLPKAEKSGYAMLVDNSKKDSIHVSISCSKVSPKTIGATMMCRGHLAYFDTLKWSNDKATFSIGKEKLLPGVQQITLFTEKGEILAERMLFVRNGNMPDNVKIAINSDKNSYKPFEKVNIDAKVTDTKGTPIETYISLTVRDGDVENSGNYSDNLCTDLLLSSDLKGYIANPAYYFESDDEEHNTALDHLMMVQGWRRYEWKTMAGLKPFKITNYLEDGISVDGEVLALSHNKPLKDIQVFMRAMSPDGMYVQDQNVITNEKGEFNFKLEDFYDDWRLTLSLSKENEKLNKNARIKINRAPMSQLRTYAQWETNTPKPIIYYATTAAAIDKATQVQDFMVLPGVTIKEEQDLLDCEVYYIHDEAENFYDKGVLMGNIAEYFPKKAPKYFSNVPADSSEEIIDPNKLYYKNKEVTIIPMRTDGSVWSSTIPTTHDNNMALLDLDDIEYILFFNNPYAHTHLRISHKNMDSSTPLLAADDAHRHYMMLVYPRKRAAVPYKLKGQRSTYVDGYSTVREFFAPDYKNAPLPGETDYRRTLYWNPLLRTDAEGNAKITFYNNGRCRRMEADAVTITPKGKLGSGKAQIAPNK